jgi:hypothetical protein
MNGVVSTGSSSRKRRGFGLFRSERDAGTQRVYLRGRFRHDRCGLCRITVFSLVITVTFTYGTTQTVTFTVVISTTIISIPATFASTTITTIASNGTTTLATATAALA